MHALARDSREIWGGWAEAAGFHIRRNGSLLFARTRAEEELLEAFCEVRAPEHGYQVELLRGERLHDLYQGQFSHHRAALLGLDDQQIYSREAIPALVDHLRREHGVEFHFSTLVRDVEPGVIHSTRGSCRAQQIIVCSGHEYQALLAAGVPPADAAGAPGARLRPEPGGAHRPQLRALRRLRRPARGRGHPRADPERAAGAGRARHPPAGQPHAPWRADHRRLPPLRQ
ncbi:FAD dependent oxidoreductase [compost metagenome]